MSTNSVINSVTNCVGISSINRVTIVTSSIYTNVTNCVTNCLINSVTIRVTIIIKNYAKNGVTKVILIV